MSQTIIATTGEEILVDDDTYEWASRQHWYMRNGYAGTYVGKGRQENMHRLIMNTPHGMHTDHINGNKLDNRRENLRICTEAENHRHARKLHKPTASKYKGVWWSKPRKKWQADIKFDGRKYFLGTFDKEEDAARAYDEAAKRFHGEFALTNF